MQCVHSDELNWQGSKAYNSTMNSKKSIVGSLNDVKINNTKI
jgi:hypothetical protein